MFALKRRPRTSGVTAGAVAAALLAILAIGAVRASRAMAEPECPAAAQNILGIGSSAQLANQSEWTGRIVPIWEAVTPPTTKLTPERGYVKACASPTASYIATSAGNGRRELGFKGGSLSRGIDFIGSDEAPNATQISNAETASGTKPLIIPVAETSIAVVFNPPENCTVKSGAHGITYAQLGEVFGGKAIKTWAGLSSLVEGVGCSSPIVRVVQGEGDDITYLFKSYLAVLEEEGFGGPSLPCTITGFNEATGTAELTTKWKKVRLDSTGEEISDVWPSPFACPGTTTVVTKSGDGALAEFVKDTHGTIGYAALPDAKGKGAMVAPLENSTLGTFGNPEASTGMKSNCGPRPYTVPTPGRANETGIAVNWSQVFGAEPAVSGNEYPLCTLTYVAAWNSYVHAGYVDPAEIAASVKDFILRFALSTAGQSLLNEHWYQELPHPAANATNVLAPRRKPPNRSAEPEERAGDKSRPSLFVGVPTMFTSSLGGADRMPASRTRQRRRMSPRTARAVPVSVRTLVALAFLVAGLSAVAAAMPSAALAGVSGELSRVPNIEFGSEQEQLFNPTAFGINPQNGDIFVLSNNITRSESTVKMFSASGEFKGSASIPRAAMRGMLPRSFVGIAVDPSRGRLYLVEVEKEADAANAEDTVGLKILVFSTTPGPDKTLTPLAPVSLPAAGDPAELLSPNEIQVDPTGDHDIVVSAKNASGQVVIRRLDPTTGSVVAEYVESGDDLSNLNPVFVSNRFNFSFGIGKTGTIYILVNNETLHPPIQAFTLPASFGSDSSLAPLAGFLDAENSEGWEDEPESDFISRNVDMAGGGFGSQIALVTASDGEEVLYWKATEFPDLPKAAQPIVIHGYSIQQEATTYSFGDQEPLVEEPCAIEAENSSLAPMADGNLAVLDQGGEVVTALMQPKWQPKVLIFGEGGGECPTPAPLIKVKSGSDLDVGTVAEGTAATLDASGTELEASEASEFVWEISKEGGLPEVIPVAGSPASPEVEHVFGAAGEYVIRLALTTKEPVRDLGDHFVAKPKTLIVTGSGTGPSPIITGLDPNKGPAAGGTTVTITGENFTGATEVKFGTGLATSLIVAPDGEHITATSPAGPAGTKVPVTVVTPGGSSTANPATVGEFEYEPASVSAPTVSKVEPNHGGATGGTVVTITGTNLTGATEVKFGSTRAGAITQVSATQLKATSPSGTQGSEVDVVVVTAGGPSATTDNDKFKYDPTHTLTLVKAGTGSGTFSCNGGACLTAYPAGTSVTVTATPVTGSAFKGWEGGGCSAASTCTVVLNSDISLTGKFEPIPSTNTPPTSGPPKQSSPAPTPTPPPGPGSLGAKKPESKQQRIQKERAAAIAKCKKLNGKAEAKCLKKARQIGKPKPKPKKAHKK